MSHFSPFSHRQRHVRDGAQSRSRRAAALASGTLLLGLTAALSPAQPVAAAATPLEGAGTCANIDMVYRDKSAFPDTARGRVDYRMQSSAIERAVLCLVNAERTAGGLRPLSRPYALGKMGKNSPPTLGNAAARHAADAVKLRWWGEVQPGKKCVPNKDNPKTSQDESKTCNSHIHPQTESTPLSRAQAVGYCRRGTPSIAENTYAGWGRGYVTARAAVSRWMGSEGHRNNILSPDFTVLYTRVAWGSADPAAGSTTPALTYVQMFGHCA
ncbi:CAP domain-containing protein [Nonomuraea turkmeniaca]|uniref:CAP domain-containing protein n=1 Tax=Nonomuraea turkmeniaca TaxID=103838 RepID=A0A5S4FSK2_9ACTN|nr:CAP domain-containing protein [Nonomuraea turkmeniaca]TMR23736.1 CAP domain-containing protein [Nonomuraea turkmeniaca]